MSNTKHMRGPWKVSKDQSGIEDAAQNQVCLFPRSRFTPERRANARLIASAPDSHELNIECLDLLRDMSEYFEAGIPIPHDRELAEEAMVLMQILQRVVAKVEGRDE